MKKAVLFGDSIRIGYGDAVTELIKNEFTVFQPTDNCRFCQYMLRMLFDYSKDISDADVIHFNSGLWDICDLFGDGAFTPPDEYVRVMKKIGSMFLKITDKVIFATSTPVRRENVYNDNGTIAQYNALIVPEFQKMGIQINDLNSLIVGNIEKYIREDDKIHLTDEGIRLCAEQTAKCILNA